MFNKFILAVTFLFSATMSANAQFSNMQNSRTPDRVHMGIRTGLTCNIYTGDSNSDAFVFPSGGLAVDFQVAPIPIFLGFGVNYVNYGFKYEKYDYKADAHSIQMPITASYHFNVAPNLFINPFLGGFAAYNTNNDFKKQFNGGLRVGCGMNFGRLTFDLGYDIGLINLANNSTSTSGTFFMNVGVNWIGSR